MTRYATLFIVYSFIIAILIIAGFSIPASAQSGSIRIEGTVWDPTGTALPGAELTAVEENTGRQSNSVSDSAGYYVFLSLPPGTYTLTAKAKGFKDVVYRSVLLFSPGTVAQDLSFEVSAIDKEMAPSESPRVSNAQNSSSLSRKGIEALPTLDRDPLALLIYQPGVQINGANPSSSTINGTRPAMNGIGMDGVSITNPVLPNLDGSLVPVSPDSISDMQIITAGANAEYGRSGGGQFTLTSRQGTKSWSREIYDYSRNKSLDANEYFNNATNVPKPKATRNIFGATVSGPVSGDKMLLFLNFEGNRTDQGITENQTVLTPTAKMGLFQWYTPGTTTLNSYNIPLNDPRHLGIDPTVAQTLATLPTFNNTQIGDGLNTAGYRFNSPAYLNQEGINLRLDRNINPNHQVFLRFNWNRIGMTDVTNNQEPAFPSMVAGTSVSNFWGFVVGSDLILNPRMINELRVGYMQPDTDLNRPARLTTPMFLANTWTNPVSPSFPASFKSPVFEVSDYLSHKKTLHTFKYGFTFRRTVQSSTNYSGAYPNVSFGLTMGNTPPDFIGPNGVLAISGRDRTTFDNLYNDLLGRIESVSQTFNSSLTTVSPAGTPGARDYVFKEYAGFIQDDWRIRPNLTLNLGLRYEISPGPQEGNGYQAVLDQASKINTSATISNFKVLQSNSWYSTDFKDFAPRAGFAWDPFESGTLVIRGSYGIYYDRLIGAVTNFLDQNSYGFSQNVALYPNSAGADLRISDGIPLPTQPSSPLLQPAMTRSSSIAVLNPNLRAPRVDQYHFTLEKRLFGAFLEAGYVGTRGRRLFQYVNLNQTKTNGDFLQAFQQLQAYRASGTPVPASNTLVQLFGSPITALNAIGGFVVDTGQAGLAADTVDRNYYANYAAAQVSNFYIRNFPQFNQFLYGSSSADSWYNALQLGVRKSTKNYGLRAYYTWSKSLDTISSNGDTFVTPSDSLNPAFNRAPSDFDRRRVVNAAFNYAIPFGRNPSSDSDRPKWMDAALGGWNLGVLYVWESGARFSVSSGLQNQYAGVIGLADLTGSRKIGSLYQDSGGIIHWFSPQEASQFAYPVAGEIPSSGRNTFVGPGYSRLDVVLQKRYLVNENRNLQLRIEAFNVLNSAQFANPDTNLYDRNFGIITSTQGNSRQIQVSLRYHF